MKRQIRPCAGRSLSLLLLLLAANPLAGCFGAKDGGLAEPTLLVDEVALYNVTDQDGRALVRVVLSFTNGTQLSAYSTEALALPEEGLPPDAILFASANVSRTTGRTTQLDLPSGTFAYPQPALAFPWGVRSQMPTADAAIFTVTVGMNLDLAEAAILAGPQIVHAAGLCRKEGSAFTWGEISGHCRSTRDSWSLTASGDCQARCGFPAPMRHFVEMEGDGAGYLPIHVVEGIEGQSSRIEWRMVDSRRGAPMPGTREVHAPDEKPLFSPVATCGFSACEGPGVPPRFSLQGYLDALMASPQWTLWREQNPDAYPFDFNIQLGFLRVLETVEVEMDGATFKFFTSPGEPTADFIFDSPVAPEPQPVGPNGTPIRTQSPFSPLPGLEPGALYEGHETPSALVPAEQAWLVAAAQTGEPYLGFESVGLSFQPSPLHPHPKEQTLWVLTYRHADGSGRMVVSSAHDGSLLRIIDIEDLAGSGPAGGLDQAGDALLCDPICVP